MMPLIAASSRTLSRTLVDSATLAKSTVSRFTSMNGTATLAGQSITRIGSKIAATPVRFNHDDFQTRNIQTRFDSVVFNETISKVKKHGNDCWRTSCSDCIETNLEKQSLGLIKWAISTGRLGEAAAHAYHRLKDKVRPIGITLFIQQDAKDQLAVLFNQGSWSSIMSDLELEIMRKWMGDARPIISYTLMIDANKNILVVPR